MPDEPAPMSPHAKKALLAAWLGWAFDGLDSYLFVAVATPLVRGLLVREHPGIDPADLAAQAGTKAAWIQAAFFVGWALGGGIFGRLGDVIGRTKVLSLTILTYAVFTAMGYFAGAWWHLLIFRFLAALGIGGEWAAGSALVAETLPSRHRAWASALLQSGYILGIIGANLAAGFFKTHDPRTVFLVGAIPALCVVWIRRHVPEPAGWSGAHARQQPPRVWALLAPGVRSATLSLGALVSIALVCAWVFLFFVPQMVRWLPEMSGRGEAEITSAATSMAIVYFLVNIAGNFAATYAAKLLGHRAALALFTLGASAFALAGFASPPASLSGLYITCCGVAFFGLGLFAVFPLYIPPRFPVLLRTLGSGVTYNLGRLVTAGGTLVAAQISLRAGGPHAAVWWVCLLYLPMLALCAVIPRDEGKNPVAGAPGSIP